MILLKKKKKKKKKTFKNESYSNNQDQFLYWKQWIDPKNKILKKIKQLIFILLKKKKKKKKNQLSLLVHRLLFSIILDKTTHVFGIGFHLDKNR